MRFLLIPGWLRRRCHREDNFRMMANTIDSLKAQLNYVQSQKHELEREINALTKNPVGASAEVWEQKYLSAMAFIFSTKRFYEYDDYLRLTEGRDYKKIVAAYAGRI